MPVITTTKPVFKPEINFQVEHEHLEERATIIHCTVTITSLIRIWPSTWLIQENGARRKLLHAFNISAYPQWKMVMPGHCFTLVFESLHKDCLLFDLYEENDEPYPFHFENIERNKMDVYWLEYPNFPFTD
jgi:hypothetical protein